MGATFGQIYAVFKLRIGVAITLCALAGLAVAPGQGLPAWKIAVLALAVLISSASAGAFNQYAERALDARMARTRNRPFATGEWRPGWYWPVGIVALLAVAVLGAGMALNPAAALYVFLGAFVYGVVYTVWLKQRTAWNIVVGGLAGSFAVLAGGAAVGHELSPTVAILAAVLFLWTPPHFWSLATALHEDYAAARVPMLPVVIGDAAAAKVILGHTVALVALSLLPVFYGLGWVYLVGAVVGGAWFVWKSLALVRSPGPVAAIANFKASLAQLGLLLLGAILDGWLLG